MNELLDFLNVRVPMWPLYILSGIVFKPYWYIRRMKATDKVYKVIFFIYEIILAISITVGILLGIWYHPPGRYGITSFAAPFMFVPFSIGASCVLLCYFATEIIPRVFRRK